MGWGEEIHAAQELEQVGVLLEARGAIRALCSQVLHHLFGPESWGGLGKDSERGDIDC